MSGLVSVVVPVFNGMPHLPHAVASALNQTYASIEVVLVDGGSTDGSWDWMTSIQDSRVRIKKMPRGTSAAENWTQACREASGDYIKLLCQDDVLHPNALAVQVEDLTSNPAAVMAVAQRDIIDASGLTVFRRWGTHGLPEGLVFGDAALLTSIQRGTNIFGEPLAVLFPREALLKALPWDDTFPFLLDVEMYTRVMTGNQIVIRKQSIGAFRISGSSWSTRMAQTQTHQLRVWQRHVISMIPTTSRERLTAALAVRIQSLIRRLVYGYLRARGAFHAAGGGETAA